MKKMFLKCESKFQKNKKIQIVIFVKNIQNIFYDTLKILQQISKIEKMLKLALDNHTK